MSRAQTARAVVGGLTRVGADPERIAEARRCLKYAKTHAYLREAVESAPLFTAEQKLQLTAILTSPAGDDDYAVTA